MSPIENHRPRLSIIIPAFNRAEMICRAIDSCLGQGYQDFEVLVVDDGSSDGTGQRVLDYQDARVILLQHETNRGVCPARNTAIGKARGEWLIMLDSDFELLPGALETIVRRISKVPGDVGNAAFSCLWDNGQLTPSPSVPEKPISFEEFLTWTDQLEVSEWFNCFRREVFTEVMYSPGRSYEALFHLNVAWRWRIEILRDAIVLIHTDAENRITRSPVDLAMQRLLTDAPDCATDAEEILRLYGDALRRWSPKQYLVHRNNAAMYNFLARRRWNGLRHSLALLADSPVDWRPWATLLSGVGGPKVIAWFKARRMQG